MGNELQASEYQLRLKKSTESADEDIVLAIHFHASEDDLWLWSFTYLHVYQAPHTLPLEEAKKQALNVVAALDIGFVDSPDLKVVPS